MKNSKQTKSEVAHYWIIAGRLLIVPVTLFFGGPYLFHSTATDGGFLPEPKEFIGILIAISGFIIGVYRIVSFIIEGVRNKNSHKLVILSLWDVVIGIAGVILLTVYFLNKF